MFSLLFNGISCGQPLSYKSKKSYGKKMATYEGIAQVSVRIHVCDLRQWIADLLQ